MYHERYTKARRKRDKEHPGSCSLSQILGLWPSRSVCDEAINSYFQSFERCLRIMHKASLMVEYERFWESEEPLRQEFKSLAPQLAVIDAIIHAWKGLSPPANENINSLDVLCFHVETWLDSLTGRQQLTMSTLRTRTLLILAQQVRGVPPDEI